jgi:hypothetical protein
LLWPWLLLSILIEILCKAQSAFSEDYPMKSILFLLAAICVFPCLAAPLEQTLEAGGFSVHITSPNTPGKNAITLQPKGLKSVNDPVTLGVEEMIASAFLEDADSDNSPEVFLILTNPGSGSHGKVLAFSTNGKKALTPIVIDEPAPKHLEGYMGHDEFTVMENTLVRRFPIYKTGDTNASPTGGWRQFQYKLKPGEAAWHFRIDRIETF